MMRSPVASSAARSSPSQTCCAEPAPAYCISLSRVKKLSRSSLVRCEMLDQQLVALGHVEIDRRRDLAEVAHRARDAVGRRQRRRRCRSCRRCRARCRDCGCRRRCGSTASSRPAPAARRRGRPAPADHLLVAAEHALRGDHRLGHAGRAGGEEELCDRVRADPRALAASTAGGRVSEQVVEQPRRRRRGFLRTTSGVVRHRPPSIARANSAPSLA